MPFCDTAPSPCALTRSGVPQAGATAPYARAAVLMDNSRSTAPRPRGRRAIPELETTESAMPLLPSTAVSDAPAQLPLSMIPVDPRATMIHCRLTKSRLGTSSALACVPRAQVSESPVHCGAHHISASHASTRSRSRRHGSARVHAVTTLRAGPRGRACVVRAHFVDALRLERTTATQHGWRFPAFPSRDGARRERA
jgi:hypothetical protein